MQLFYSVNSPYARKARVVAIEKGLMERVSLRAVNSLENPPELIAANPLCKVPALVCDDGVALCESPVICEYLDSLAPQPVLYPPSGPERFEALAIAALADGVMDAAVGTVVESRKPETQQSPEWHTRYVSAIERTLERLAAYVPEAGAAPRIDRIALAVALAYLEFRTPFITWRKKHVALAEWFDSFASRPSMQATRPAL